MKYLATILITCLPLIANAAPPEIISVDTTKGSNGWNISVTLAHPDTGWDHYADGWEVLDMDGNRLGIRELAHPHVNEQPFTRSLGGLVIPEGVDTIQIRARCIVDGWNSEVFEVDLTQK